LAEVLGQYHARGVVPLWTRLLCLCEMTADRPPWTGTVTALSLPSPLEVQHRVAQVLTVDFGTPSYKFTVNICTYLIF
jgi:hypothetical protein